MFVYFHCRLAILSRKAIVLIYNVVVSISFAPPSHLIPREDKAPPVLWLQELFYKHRLHKTTTSMSERRGGLPNYEPPLCRS